MLLNVKGLFRYIKIFDLKKDLTCVIFISKWSQTNEKIPEVA